MAAKRSVVKRGVQRLPHRISTMGQAVDPSADSGRWWEAEGDAGVAQARSLLSTLHSLHGQRRLYDDLYTGLYEAQPPFWLIQMRAGAPIVQAASIMNSYTKARANIIRRCVDTAAAMLAKNPAEIRCQTDGASWKLQKRARQQTKYINGLLRECGFHEIQQRAFIDATLTRSGGLAKMWIDRRNKRIRCDRVHPGAFLWNDYEAPPLHNAGIRTLEARSVLMDRYPEKADEIRHTPHGTNPQLTHIYRRMFGNELMADQVEVSEMWHLTEDAEKPGRHIMALANVTLEDEPWEFDFFPIARLFWAEADRGSCNSPVAEQLVGYHTQVGEMMLTISKSQRLACVPRVFIEKGSEVVEDEVTNAIGGVVHYTGTPPTIGPASAMPPEFYQYLNQLVAWAMADTGLNEFQAQGTLPMGMQDASGRALREMNDTGSTRQVLKGQRIERHTVTAGEMGFRLSAKLAKESPDFAVNALGARSYEKIKWDDVEGDIRDIRMVTTPTSMLGSTTSGRIQNVVDIIKGGLLPPEEVQGGLGLQLLNFPDLEKVVTMETAIRELIEMMVDGALYDGEYFAPEPYLGPQGLTLLKTMACRSYFHALQMDGVPSRNLDMLRRLMSEADFLTQNFAANQAPIQQPQAAVPPPAPAPLEQSPMAPPPLPEMPMPGGGLPQ
jgi:hypothetical protein